MDRAFSEAIGLEVPRDCLLISVGLPGSWKSPVTEEIARMKGHKILRSDFIRREVLEGKDIFDEKVASNPDNRRRVYGEMFKRAEAMLKGGTGGLILDATFFTQELRSRAAKLAHEASKPLVIAECVCTEKASIRRILKRTKENYESNALTRQAYLNNKKIFEPVDIDELKRNYRDLSITQLAIDTEFDDQPRWRVTTIKKR
ncbi:MAG: ATP-binding protein [Syntrophobacterales bacterium]|nr:MAG: ATP-binding protein [Syntrophobacterales bacterium]